MTVIRESTKIRMSGIEVEGIDAAEVATQADMLEPGTWPVDIVGYVGTRKLFMIGGDRGMVGKGWNAKDDGSLVLRGNYYRCKKDGMKT
jgi:hypothetical protein